MSLALTVPAAVVEGAEITITGTGFTANGQATVRVKSPNSNMDIQFSLTANGSGAITSVGKVSVVPRHSGPFTVTVTDVTATTQISKNVQVSRSSG